MCVYRQNNRPHEKESIIKADKLFIIEKPLQFRAGNYLTNTWLPEYDYTIALV